MDPIQFPENLSELSVEDLNALATQARNALSALFELETPTPADAAEAERLNAGVVSVTGELSAREQAVVTMAALRDSFQSEPEAEAEAEAPADEPAEEEPAEPAEEGEPESQEEPVEPSSGFNSEAVDGQRPAAPVRATGKRFTAAVDVPGIPAASEISYTQVAEALLEKFASFPKPNGSSEQFGTDIRTFGLAQLDKGLPDDLIITDAMGYEEKMAVIDRAVDEKRLPGGSLVAAGGWCAPSETSYDLADDGSTTDGLLSLAEVGLGRGGVRFTLGPDFADIYALNNFFKMTEAQAIAGSFTKPCFTVTCPTFADHRMDAYGYCFQVPFLTEAAYPEVIKRYLSGSMTAYAHKMNLEKINQVLALLPAAEVAQVVGASVSSLAAALQLLIDRERGKRRWSFNQAVEVVLPYWVKGLLKLDIGNRAGRNSASVSDQEINAVFAQANANPQWIYDWQMLADDALVYPDTFDIMVYKAGTFVAGTTSVVNLSSVYDAASLSANIYTGAFFEEGMVVFRRGFGGIRVTVPVCISGEMGALDVTDCGIAVAP